MRYITHKLRASSSDLQGGFTLLEMAVVIIIVGLMIAMFAPVYKTYLENVAMQTTRNNLVAVEYQIQVFRKKYGRYPLPASYEAERDNPAYGYESDWNKDDHPPYAQPFELPSNNFTLNPDWDDPNTTVTTYPVNTCSDGICVRLGNRLTLDLNPVDGVADTAPRVRIGAVPFRSLDLDEEQSLDGYGNRLSYAVVERLARATTYDEIGGAIGITDETGVSLIADAEDPMIEAVAHFVLLSHGANGYGAYTRAGRSRGCPSESADLANTVCDGGSGPAVFVMAQRTTASGAAEYDDVFASFLKDMPPAWKFSENNPDDVFIDNNGPIGVLTDNPQERLDVNGVVQANTGIFSDAYCDQTIAGACFSPLLIAGPGNDTPGPGRNVCNEGEFMVGIKNSEIVCQQSVQISCPVGEIMTGVASSGEPLCQNVPDCLATTNSLCGTSYTVSSRDIGQTFVHGSPDLHVTSTCTSLGWQHAQTGQCPTVQCFVKATSFSNFAPLSGSRLVGEPCTCNTTISRCHQASSPQRGSGCSCSQL